MISVHVPVLPSKIIDLLAVKAGKRYIDATVGGGGHTEAILKKGGEVLGIDQDPISLEIAYKHLVSSFGSSAGARRACPGTFSIDERTSGAFKLVLGNFSNLHKIASEQGFVHVDGILFDLGFASFQVDDPERGLALSREGPLDMRLDPGLGVTAKDLLNILPEPEIYKLIKEVGGEKRARSIARAIVARRSLQPFSRTDELKDLIENVYQLKGVRESRLKNGREKAYFTKSGLNAFMPKVKLHPATKTFMAFMPKVKLHPATKTFMAFMPKVKLHPATKTFMALRIAVNNELENLKLALPQALGLVKQNGRIAVISFHSGEDRIVKNFFKRWELEEKGWSLTKKPLVPTEREVLANPRSRSAKLRVFKKNGKNKRHKL